MRAVNYSRKILEHETIEYGVIIVQCPVWRAEAHLFESMDHCEFRIGCEANAAIPHAHSPFLASSFFAGCCIRRITLPQGL